jgi:hypothetical protein
MATNNSNRGFAGMDKDEQRAIASKDGKAHGTSSSRASTGTKSTRGAAGSTEAARRGGEK